MSADPTTTPEQAAATGRIAALGEETRVAGFALAGAVALPAEEPEAVRAAWDGMDDDVVLVLLTPAAADALAGRLDAIGSRRLTAVLPA
jgi:vacuolar-type H+-ATPase subunit F/Vma7